MKKIVVIFAMLSTTIAFAQDQQKPASNSIETTSATGNAQTTIVDVNGNLKVMTPDAANPPAQVPAPAQKPATQQTETTETTTTTTTP